MHVDVANRTSLRQPLGQTMNTLLYTFFMIAARWFWRDLVMIASVVEANLSYLVWPRQRRFYP